MKNSNSDSSTDTRSKTLSISSQRRKVLSTIAALGLGGVASGSASGKRGRGKKNGDQENDDEKCESAGVPTSIQTWTLRSLPDTVPDLIRRVGAVGNNGGPSYDGIGLTSLGEASQSELIEALDQTELDVSNAHVGLSQLEDNYEETVQTYKELGVTDLVHSYIPPEDIETVDQVEELASRMNEVADKLEEEGMRYGIHNHNQEFQELDDGRIPFEVFDENLSDNVIFEFDVGWALVGGYDPAEVIEQYSDRTELIHMKDMTADGEFTEIGEGDVDMREVAQVSRNVANVDYLIYEHDEPENPAASASTGAGVLSLLDGEPGIEGIGLEDMGGPDYSGELSGEEEYDNAPGQGNSPARGNPSEQGRQNRNKWC